MSGVRVAEPASMTIEIPVLPINLMLSTDDIDLAFLIELNVKAIDENFGDGYAKAHPELLAAIHQAGAIWRLAAAIQNHPGL